MTTDFIEVYLNSNYKKTAEKLTSLNFQPTNVPPTSRQVGDVVIVKYVIRKKRLHYAGVIQNISGDEFMIQFLKRSREKTFSIKLEASSVKIFGSVNVNSRGQYIINENLTFNLDM